MQRITRKDLEWAVNRLNRITGNQAEPYRGEHGKWFANIGNFHISGAYGGVSLHQMMNDAGACGIYLVKAMSPCVNCITSFTPI